MGTTDGVDIKRIGARIRQARTDAGHDNAAKFADLIGIRSHTLWRYEAGQMLPGLDALVSICRVLPVHLWWVATGEGPMRRRATAATGTEG